MKFLAFINPTRRLVGRLFLWFWVTLVLTAVTSAWLARMFYQPFQIEQPSNTDIQELVSMVNELEMRKADYDRFRPFLRDLSIRKRRSFISVNLDTGRVMSDGGPPLRQDEENLLAQFARQSNYISVQLGPMVAVGPVLVDFNGTSHAVFWRHPDGKGGPERLFTWLIPTAVIISALFCWLFAKSIVRPIRHLQHTGRKLAEGDWQARTDIKAFRRDEIGELAADFNLMAEQLSTMWSGQKRLLADISHELRSPLARMQMAIGLAHQQEVDTPTLDRIEREAIRMEALINQLLQLTRAEAGKPALGKVNLRETMRELFQDAAFEASTNSKHFNCDEIPDIVLRADATQLNSAVENVLRNAIRYADTQVEAAFTVKDDQVTLVVQDDGPGLTPQECEEIFRPFYRPSASRERKSGGVGLGLAIAQAAIALHRGTISAKPGDSGGLVVTITVPLGNERE